MNKNFIYRFIIFIFCGFILPFSLHGQHSYPAEKIGLMTDRPLYFSGETVFFSGTISLNGEKNILSEAVYIECVSPSGLKINHSKVKIIDNNFEGQLIIPENALSGYYYIRAYTKWMRNGPVSDYSYVLIKLINPYSQDLLEINDSLIDQHYATENETDQDKLLNKTSFHTSEKAILNTKKIKDLSFNLASISVYPKVANSAYFYTNNLNSSFYDSILYYPETRALTISGKVIDVDGLPIPFHKVNLHLKDEKDFISVLSDSSGHFYVSLPERIGTNELLVIAATEGNEKISVLIDQDLCTRPFYLKVPPFSIADNERDQLLLMAQTLQLNEIFNEEDSLSPIPTLSHLPFYGSAYKSIVFDSYIELDSLSQYFTDLPSWVNVKKLKGKRKLFIIGPEAELSFIQPLVLIDFVPVDDIESILKIDPRRIDRFEVVVKPYIHGGIIYGGIIALYSRNNDFGGFTFPESAMYINYDFYDPLKEDRILSNDTVLAFNNTFIWIPIIANEHLLEPMEFILPSIKGDYIFQFQYINESGEKKRYQNIFSMGQ